MKNAYIEVQKSGPLSGTLSVAGSKNASMVVMLCSLLVKGISRFYNIPSLIDVAEILGLLQDLGASVEYDAEKQVVIIDTTHADGYTVASERMRRTRASILALGALLARGKKASVGLPGGDSIGTRPIDFHLKNLQKMGAEIVVDNEYVHANVKKELVGQYIVLDYPSVGATENIVLAAVGARGRTTIVNAALEPEVIDCIHLLRAMGASIVIQEYATIIIDGGLSLHPVSYTIIPDRLEAGAVLIAAAMTGGDVTIPNIHGSLLDVVLLKLQEMGHTIIMDRACDGVRLIAHNRSSGASFKTSPYPGFPTDLQAPMMAALVCARGESVIEETVFENRLQHVASLNAMGASIVIQHANKAVVSGVDALRGTTVEATDIRASCALVMAGLIAEGTTRIYGVNHWKRGFDALEKRLHYLGALIRIIDNEIMITEVDPIIQRQA